MPLKGWNDLALFRYWTHCCPSGSIYFQELNSKNRLSETKFSFSKIHRDPKNEHVFEILQIPSFYFNKHSKKIKLKIDTFLFWPQIGQHCFLLDHCPCNPTIFKGYWPEKILGGSFLGFNASKWINWHRDQKRTQLLIKCLQFFNSIRYTTVPKYCP